MATTTEKITPESEALESIDFGIKKSIRYHSKRRAFFERVDNISNWLVAVAGASAFASVVGDSGSLLSKILTFLITAIALADVILSFGARARLHQDLYRRFSELAIELSNIHSPTIHDIARLRAKRLSLEAEEPHIIDALERFCWNEEAAARGADPEQLHSLTKWQRLRARLS
jgi:hypothetical protein